MSRAARVAGLVAAAGLVGASVAAYVAWTRPTVETRRAACERRILARMGFAAREKLPREDAGDGTTRTASTLPAEVETQLRDRARQVCAHLPEEPEPTTAVQGFVASAASVEATATATCCARRADGSCDFWSTACPSPDPRPVECCQTRADGSCGWWSRVGCP